MQATARTRAQHCSMACAQRQCTMAKNGKPGRRVLCHMQYHPHHNLHPSLTQAGLLHDAALEDHQGHEEQHVEGRADEGKHGGARVRARVNLGPGRLCSRTRMGMVSDSTTRRRAPGARAGRENARGGGVHVESVQDARGNTQHAHAAEVLARMRTRTYTHTSAHTTTHTVTPNG